MIFLQLFMLKDDLFAVELLHVITTSVWEKYVTVFFFSMLEISQTQIGNSWGESERRHIDQITRYYFIVLYCWSWMESGGAEHLVHDKLGLDMQID